MVHRIQHASAARRRVWHAALFTGALLARIYFAGRLFLDPDEALHYWLSVQPSLAAAYRATLTTAHPPLLILFLYCWQLLGHSEILLRLPGIVAGLAFSWIGYHWIRRAADQETAEIALPLLLFAPPLIWLSAEVRQYWLLLLFVAIALYCFERALAQQSAGWIAGFSLALDFALLSHYSSLLFALSMGLYALARLKTLRTNRGLLWAWAIGQVSALAEIWFLFVHHITLLRKSGLPQEIADTWLRKCIYHSSEDHFIPFLLRETVRLFRYLLGNGIAGALGLAAFCLGMFLLFRKARKEKESADRCSLVWLICLPFAVAIIASLAGLYPYGGTRHDVFLAPFAIFGISIALSSWNDRRAGVCTAAILLTLALVNLFPSPAGPFIRPPDRAKPLMASAIGALRASPPGSIVFTDYQGGLVLGYYLCGQPAVQFEPPYSGFTRSFCGELTVISESPRQWAFEARDFAEKYSELVRIYSLSPESDVLIFQAGWSVGTDPALLKVLEDLGCKSPLHFGKNVLICQIKGVG